MNEQSTGNNQSEKYDAYEDLGLSRSLDCRELSDRLGERISGVSPDDAAELDKLNTMRTILASQATRDVYDRELDDPTVSTLGVRRLREIASRVASSHSTEGSELGTNPPISQDSSFGTGYATASAHPVSQPLGQHAPQHVPHNNHTAQYQPPAGQEYAPNTPFAAGNVQPGGQAHVPPQTVGSPSQTAQGGSGFNINVDFSKFPITEHRSRSGSLMWAIGWGWIFLGWLYLLLQLLTFDGGESSSRGREGMWGELSTYSQQMDQVTSILGVVILVIFNTVATAVFLQLLWNIRYLVGKRDNQSGSNA